MLSLSVRCRHGCCKLAKLLGMILRSKFGRRQAKQQTRSTLLARFACTVMHDAWRSLDVKVPCFMEAWHGFVVAAGGSFPVAPRNAGESFVQIPMHMPIRDSGSPGRSLASEALQAFFHQDLSDSFSTDLATDGDNFTGRCPHGFHQQLIAQPVLSSQGHPKFVVIRLLVNAPRNGGLGLRLGRTGMLIWYNSCTRRVVTKAATTEIQLDAFRGRPQQCFRLTLSKRCW